MGIHFSIEEDGLSLNDDLNFEDRPTEVFEEDAVE